MMIESDILRLAANGESHAVEFKESWPDRSERIAREIVSFANGNGGIILVGVSDSGKLIGVEENKDRRQQWLMNIVDDYVHPFIMVTYLSLIHI